MIDVEKRNSKHEQKEKVRRRMRVEIDPDNYEYIPEKKKADFYDVETPQLVGIYVRVSTEDVRQTTSFELQKKYYEEYVSHTPIGLSSRFMRTRVSAVHHLRIVRHSSR